MEGGRGVRTLGWFEMKGKHTREVPKVSVLPCILGNTAGKSTARMHTIVESIIMARYAVMKAGAKERKRERVRKGKTSGRQKKINKNKKKNRYAF